MYIKLLTLKVNSMLHLVVKYEVETYASIQSWSILDIVDRYCQEIKGTCLDTVSCDRIQIILFMFIHLFHIIHSCQIIFYFRIRKSFD